MFFGRQSLGAQTGLPVSYMAWIRHCIDLRVLDANVSISSKQNLSSATIQVNLSQPNPGRQEEINLNFYFYTFLSRHPKKVWKEKFRLIFILVQLSEIYGAGRIKIKSLRYSWKLQEEFSCIVNAFLRPESIQNESFPKCTC